MHVRTDDPRDEYRLYSHRKYNDRFRRKTTSNFDFHRHDEHHHSSRRHSSKRTANPPSNRFDRTVYSSSYYTRERDLPIHYNDSEPHNRYSSPATTTTTTFRREISPRNDYRSSIDLYNDNTYYSNRSERYDIPQNRLGSIITNSSPSPVYHSDSSYSTTYNHTRDQYPTPMREIDYRAREYGSMTSINHHLTGPSKHYRSPSPLTYEERSNFKRSRTDGYETLSSKRPPTMMRREQFQQY